MVYYLSWKPGEMPCLPDYWEHYLPEKRIKKANSYKQEKDRVTSVLAFLLLRYALFKEYAITAMPQLETDENGKPFAVNGDYHFNLSHCDTAVACAVYSDSVGVDVQDFRPVHENVVNRVCSESEQQRLRESGYDEKLFAAFWAGKEAYGKYLGDGIGYDLKKHSFCPGQDFPQNVQFGGLWLQTALNDNFALSACACEQQAVAQVSYAHLTHLLSVCDELSEKK